MTSYFLILNLLSCMCVWVCVCVCVFCIRHHSKNTFPSSFRCTLLLPLLLLTESSIDRNSTHAHTRLPLLFALFFNGELRTYELDDLPPLRMIVCACVCVRVCARTYLDFYPRSARCRSGSNVLVVVVAAAACCCALIFVGTTSPARPTPSPPPPLVDDTCCCGDCWWNSVFGGSFFL